MKRALLFLLLSLLPLGAVELPPQFSSNMVLQRGVKNRIWGKATADPKAAVYIEFQTTLNNKTYSERAESSKLRTDQWEVLLPEIDRRVKVPGTLTIWEGTSKAAKGGVRITLQNVAIGDVWVVALPPGKGLRQAPSNAPPTLRALILDNVAALSAPGKPGWLGASSMDSLDVLAFQFGRTLCALEMAPPQGIVVLPFGELPPWLLTEAREHSLMSLIKNAQGEASSILRRRRGSSERELIALKHAGKVGAGESIPPYDLFDFYTRSEKDPLLLNYKGLFAPSTKR
jgi:hypothetical protein